MKRATLLSFLFALAVRLSAYVQAPTGTFTTDGSQADVQAAISAASANAIIIIPAGTFTWSTAGNGVVITAIDGISIQGAGIGLTIINDECAGGAANAVFNFQNYHLEGKTFSISGMTIDSHATLYSRHTILTSAPMCKIGLIKMTDVGPLSGTRGIFISSAQGNYPMANALIYECELIGRAQAGASQLITVTGNDYEFPPTVGSGTQSSWYLPAGMGGPLATFVENCILTNTHNQDSTIETYSGGRVVVRYCTLNNFILGAHGNDSSTRSGHTIEIYNNTIVQTLGSAMPTTNYVRGGVSYFYNNTVTESGGGTTYPMDLQVYRAAGFNLTNGNPFLLTLTTEAGNFVTGRTYTIGVVGNTDWVAIGAASNTAGVVFDASGPGSGTGTASNTSYVGRYDYVVASDRYERAAKPGTSSASAAGIVAGREYRIKVVSNTSWTAIGASANTVGVVFTATGAGAGGGEATETQRYFGYVSGEWRLYGDGLHQLTHPGAGTLMRDQVVTYPAGSYAASGSGDLIVSAGGVVRIYNNNLLNGGQPTDNNTAVVNGSGTHTGSNGAAVLTDATKAWATDEMLGDGTAALDDELFAYCVWNLTSGASAFVQSNTGTTLTAPLSGGSRQTWDAGDSYVITMGYPGLDMVGRGGPTRFFATYSTQATVPCYVWSNTFNGSADVRPINVSWAGLYDTTNSPFITSLVQEGRDYFNNAGAPPGYTPYTYPHPLRNFGPAPQAQSAPAVGTGF